MWLVEGVCRWDEDLERMQEEGELMQRKGMGRRGEGGGGTQDVSDEAGRVLRSMMKLLMSDL